jgi:hypothetical protein
VEDTAWVARRNEEKREGIEIGVREQMRAPHWTRIRSYRKPLQPGVHSGFVLRIFFGFGLIPPIMFLYLLIPPAAGTAAVRPVVRYMAGWLV